MPEASLVHQVAEKFEVDVIVPVHNAAATIEQTLASALNQECNGHRVPPESLVIYICCYDDGSTDESWSILERISEEQQASTSPSPIETHLLIARSSTSRGAGFARNRAVSMRPFNNSSFLCFLDSDDIMHPNRVAEQVTYMLSLSLDERQRTLLGCTFLRDPPDSTWHYTEWANNLSDERLELERFREVAILQPTWMMCRDRFEALGGYIEAPDVSSEVCFQSFLQQEKSRNPGIFRLIHPDFDDFDTIRVAEDLRLFHAHLQMNGRLRLVRSEMPLLLYRHRAGQSQSSQTPRRLLLQLRTLAFESVVLRTDPLWQQHHGFFVIWGAGRDGKEFCKALSPEARKRVYCFVDVDDRKIAQGYYVNKVINVRIPVVHFSWLVRDAALRARLQKAWVDGTDEQDPGFARLSKSRRIVKSKAPQASEPQTKRQRRLSNHPGSEVDENLLPRLPVVVCVAMYRTQGALEHNVCTIGRIEGRDLWHFS